MKRISVLRLAYILTLFSCICASCNHKELADAPEPQTRIRVVFDWSDAPDADPAGMSVFFYDPESDQYLRCDFRGKEGGYVEIPYGKYHIATYNNDTEAITISDPHSFYGHYIFTRDGNLLEGALGNSMPVAPRAVGSESERVTITPDMIWGETRENHIIELKPGDSEAVITLRPHELCAVYSYEIRNVENLGHITNMCAALSGMSSGLTLHGESLDRECATLSLPASSDGNRTITGRFYTFGHHPENDDPHRMTLYVWMDDGRKLAYGVTSSPKWDVTDQIHSAPNQKRVHFIIDGLDIPSPMPNGLFGADADDWFSEEYELPI